MRADFERLLRRVLDAHRPAVRSIEGARDAAVLIPVVGGGDEALIFTIRTDTLPSHKGQISFPGGSLDPTDASIEAAALREAHEELSLDPGAVRILGCLDTVPTFVSGFAVTPVVGWLDDLPPLEPNPHEVAEVLLVPVAALADDIRAEPGFSHGGRTYPTEAWIYEGHVIWGVTARILRLFLYRLAEAGLAPAPPETSSPWPRASGSAP